MKYLIILCVSVAAGFGARGQLPDFPLHANGLLYSDTLMGQLKHLADSVRLHARRPAVEGAYYSIKQTTGRVVRVDTGNIYDAFRDLRSGISYEAFVAKYPQSGPAAKIMVLLNERQGYQAAGNADYLKIPVDDRTYNGAGRIILETDEHYRPIADSVRHQGFNDGRSGIVGNCVYSFSREQHMYKGKNTDYPYVFAYYLDSAPSAIRLSETATRLIAWRDRILDTSSSVYYKDAGYGGMIDLRDKDFGPAQKAFDSYIQQNGASVDTTFRRLLGAAITEVEEKHYFPFIYLERYMDDYAPVTALDIRRRWIPVMTDNFDQLTPRLYAMHIAFLAAETGNWNVFLHAHLAVAIDPSGHYPDLTSSAYGRNCFLRELELLNIGIDEILLGNELTSPWPDVSFYRATRLGRTLALEGGDKIKLEETLLKLIADKGLDDYHRLDMHYLFLNYVSFLPDERERNEQLSRLEDADKTLPGYLSARVRVDKQTVTNHMDLPAW